MLKTFGDYELQAQLQKQSLLVNEILEHKEPNKSLLQVSGTQ